MGLIKQKNKPTSSFILFCALNEKPEQNAYGHLESYKTPNIHLKQPPKEQTNKER